MIILHDHPSQSSWLFCTILLRSMLMSISPVAFFRLWAWITSSPCTFEGFCLGLRTSYLVDLQAFYLVDLQVYYLVWSTNLSCWSMNLLSCWLTSLLSFDLQIYLLSFFIFILKLCFSSSLLLQSRHLSRIARLQSHFDLIYRSL